MDCEQSLSIAFRIGRQTHIVYSGDVRIFLTRGRHTRTRFTCVWVSQSGTEIGIKIKMFSVFFHYFKNILNDDLSVIIVSCVMKITRRELYLPFLVFVKKKISQEFI